MRKISTKTHRVLDYLTGVTLIAALFEGAFGLKLLPVRGGGSR